MHSTRTRTRTYTHAHLPSSAWLTVNNWSTSTTNSARITFSQRPKTVTFNGDLSDFLNSNQGDDDHPLPKLVKTQKTTAIYLFFSAHPSSRWCRISTGGVLTRRWHHRRIWLIRMDPSPWKLWVSYKFCCPLFSLKLYWSWKTDERTSVIYNLARVLWALHHQIVETGGKYGVVAVMDTVYRM